MKNKNVLHLEKALTDLGYIKKSSSSKSWYIFGIKSITSLGWNTYEDNFSGYLHFDANKLTDKKEIDETKISLKELSLNQIKNYLKLISNKRVYDLIKYDYSRKFRKILSLRRTSKLDSFKNKIDEISLSIENNLLQEYNDIKNIYVNNLNNRTSSQKYYLSFENFYKTFESLPNSSSRQDVDALNQKIGVELSGARDNVMNWIEKHRKKISRSTKQEAIFSEVNKKYLEGFDEKFYNVDHLFERTIIDITELDISEEFNLKHEDFVLLYEESLDKEDCFKNFIKYYISRELIAVKAINSSSKLKEENNGLNSLLNSDFYSLKEVKKDEVLRNVLTKTNIVDDTTPESVKRYLTLILSFCEKICNHKNYSNDIGLINNITGNNVSNEEALYLLMNPLDTFKKLTGKCNPYFDASLKKFVKLLKARYNNYEMLEECSIYFKN
jgi:hypothetical protein